MRQQRMKRRTSADKRCRDCGEVSCKDPASAQDFVRLYTAKRCRGKASSISPSQPATQHEKEKRGLRIGAQTKKAAEHPDEPSAAESAGLQVARKLRGEAQATEACF
eukprot:TRINITY_DN121683_c0_g1_i1.p1 TRINITY_DN121683_c0_g1~~TRINITY_DN121683_c0_g1_i1.p1  ORF type:complete len:107 (-),score=18.26 TRINITY_DN121683_c0_g1_i1:263-583(-)